MVAVFYFCAMPDLKSELERAERQAYIALENAFKTIDAFAEPSLSPDMFNNYVELKEYLLKKYKGGSFRDNGEAD